ncbi:uncharacterized protein LOC125945442 [Dermacentor silvarum]|uniref:uncharacterized protein LOC125945442 n=1 Tax=Dermacentor silvarum TaxID=543639 RepID=UPI002100FC2D|nr:uncharacterized protein LOC125945442 [Dermacentor silvarum]
MSYTNQSPVESPVLYRNRAMRSEWASTATRPHQPPSETNRKEFEPTANPAATTSGYAMPSVYYLRRRLLRHHSSQTEEDPCTETDSTQGSCGSPLQKYQPSPPQARRRTSSFAAADAVCCPREPRTSDLDSSLVSSSSGSGGLPPGVALLRFGGSATTHTDKGPSPTRSASAAVQCHSSEAGDEAAQCGGGGGDTGYGETSSSEEQESSWSRSTESSAAPSSSSSPSGDTASGALASVSDDQDETQAEDDDEDDEDDDGEVDLSKLETQTQAAPFKWPPTTISQAPTGEVRMLGCACFNVVTLRALVAENPVSASSRVVRYTEKCRIYLGICICHALLHGKRYMRVILPHPSIAKVAHTLSYILDKWISRNFENDSLQTNVMKQNTDSACLVWKIFSDSNIKNAKE